MNPKDCLRALGRAHTYDPGRNAGLRAGFLFGLLVSILPMACDWAFYGTGRWNPLEEIRSHPIYLLLLTHPILFGILFGAIGTIRRDLDDVHARDVTMLSGLAMTDPLTGLYNRRYVEEELKNLLHRADRLGGPVSVVFFDLDHFKEVNQREGHRGGDLMLQMVAEALQSVLRQGEILGRYGGDEFLLVVAADLPYTANLVERAGAAVKLWTRMTLSAGIARSRDDGTTPEELIAAADERLAKAQMKHHAEESLSTRSRT